MPAAQAQERVTPIQRAILSRASTELCKWLAAQPIEQVRAWPVQETDLSALLDDEVMGKNLPSWGFQKRIAAAALAGMDGEAWDVLYDLSVSGMVTFQQMAIQAGHPDQAQAAVGVQARLMALLGVDASDPRLYESVTGPDGQARPRYAPHELAGSRAPEWYHGVMERLKGRILARLG